MCNSSVLRYEYTSINLTNQESHMKPFRIKRVLTLAALIFSVTVTANPDAVVNLSAKYDKQYRLIKPDEYLLRNGLVAYQKGNNELAFDYFMKAAAFGNTDAQMYLGLMYIKSLGVGQNWAKGYAWLELAAMDETKKHVDLKNHIRAQLKPEEIEAVKVEIAEIDKDYNASATLKRRDRWVRKQKLKITGSRTGSQALVGRLVNQDLNGVVIARNVEKRIEAMQQFVDDFNFGYVTGGPIETVDKKNEK